MARAIKREYLAVHYWIKALNLRLAVNNFTSVINFSGLFLQREFAVLCRCGGAGPSGVGDGVSQDAEESKAETTHSQTKNEAVSQIIVA